MDVPVIAASRFKCYIKYANLLCRYRCKITLSDKIPGKCIVWLSDRKYHRFGMCTHCLIFIRKIAFACLPHFLCQIKYRPCFWPAGIKSNVCNNSCDLFLCYSMIFCILQMELQRRICDSLCHKSNHRNDASSLYINVIIIPVFSK